MEFADLIKTPKLDNVILREQLGLQVDGTLCITGHHLILSSRRKDGNEELWLLHSNVDSIEKKITGMMGGTIVIKCKDFKVIQLDIPGVEECNNIANSVEWLSNLGDVNYSYPFFYRAMFDIPEDGWTAFLPESEYAKLLNTRADEWRISNVNKSFSVCESYPQTLVVPKCIDDEVLIASANFRQFGRFPVLGYYHNENGAVLLRSGQPMIGPNGRRCKEDERLINSVLKPGKRGYIIDTRTQNLAQMAKAKGGGYEPEVHYPQWRRVHKVIDRNHIIMDSFCRLIEACNDQTLTMDKWLSRLESSNWMSHIKDVLNCACLVAQCIDQEGASVLVHGSEGLDSTLQVTSLAQVILDPDCRTVRGFEALVEREWLQAGHPFAQRCQRSVFAPSTARNKNQSPSFLMFLDCVWQIHQQFPCSFEFNEQFLVMLFEHAYSSQFGTFLGCNEYERKEMKLSERTVSLWSHVNRPEILQSHINPLYEPNNRVTWPSVAPMSLNLWIGLYLRWVVDQRPHVQMQKTVAEIRDRDKDLRSQVVRLRRQLIELEREAVESGIIPHSAAHIA